MGIASLAGLVLSRSQHAELVGHCRHDPAFPDWLAWNKLQIRAASVFLRKNHAVDTWSLDVDDFMAWCANVRVTPCLEALQAYADVRNGEDGEALYREHPPGERRALDQPLEPDGSAER